MSGMVESSPSRLYIGDEILVNCAVRSMLATELYEASTSKPLDTEFGRDWRPGIIHYIHGTIAFSLLDDGSIFIIFLHL